MVWSWKDGGEKSEKGNEAPLIGSFRERSEEVSFPGATRFTERPGRDGGFPPMTAAAVIPRLLRRQNPLDVGRWNQRRLASETKEEAGLCGLAPPPTRRSVYSACSPFFFTLVDVIRMVLLQDVRLKVVGVKKNNVFGIILSLKNDFDRDTYGCEPPQLQINNMLILIIKIFRCRK